MGVVALFISGKPSDVEAATQYLIGLGTMTPRKVLYSSDVPSPIDEWLRRHMEIEFEQMEEISEGNVH